MRFHLTSLDRAKRTAERLRGALDTSRDIELSQSAARHILAAMLGYADWAELKKVTERHDQEPSPFDELLEPSDLKARLGEQARILAAALGLEPYFAARLVADIRATAHPAGPHRVFGPSSLPPPNAVEYRGHANGRRILAGLLELGRDLIFATQDIPAMLKADEKEARAIIANTTTKIFMRPEEMDQTATLTRDPESNGLRAQIGGFAGGELKTVSIPAPTPSELKTSGPYLVDPDGSRSKDPGMPPNIVAVANLKELEIAVTAKSVRNAEFVRSLDILDTDAPAKPEKLREATRLDRSTAMSDLTVLETPNMVRVVARMRAPNETTLTATVTLNGNRAFPDLDASVRWATGAPSAEDIAEGNFQSTGPSEWDSEEFLTALRMCGLYRAEGPDPFALSDWLASLSPDQRPDLVKATAEWDKHILKAGLDALRPRIDKTAIDALRVSSSHLLHDDHAYGFVRDIPRNAWTRKTLLTYPMIFAEIWGSPEVWEGDGKQQDLRKRLVETGLTLKNTDYGRWLSLPPLPVWLLDWLGGRSFSPGSWTYDTHVRDAMVLLSVLGPAFAPSTEADWQAMKLLLEAMRTVTDSVGDPWHERMPTDGWRTLFSGAEGGWADYVGSFWPSPQHRHLELLISQRFLLPKVAAIGLDPTEWDPVSTHLEPDEIAMPLIDALGREPMNEWLTNVRSAEPEVRP